MYIHICGCKICLIDNCWRKISYSSTIARAFIPLLFFSFPSILFGWPALGAIGKEKETTFTTIITAFLQIGGLLALLLIGQFNVIDLALLRGFTEACMFAMRYRYCRRFKGEFAI